ncbi:MAG: hydantoinase/oxoprolinase family protein [Methylohalobius sp.]
MSFWVGWDLGGAHLKAALVQGRKVKAVWQIACPLWQGLSYLDRALELVSAHLPDDCIHGLTMTGEMVDLFDNRQHGVSALLDTFSSKFERARTFLFVDGKFIPLSYSIPPNPQKIASNNWKLTAQYLSQKETETLCLDIGSTTCDIIPIRQGKPDCRGDDDYSRLRCGELVYTGVIRTPLAALTKTVPFDGEWLPLMAEHFATTGDIYRILNLLPKYADQAETADGKPKTKAASMQRLARMIGLDREAAPDKAWLELARYFHEIQLQSLTQACLRQLSRGFSNQTVVIGAGVGRFLAEMLAQRLNLRYRDLSEHFDCESSCRTDFSAADCAPAAALACLLAAHLGSLNDSC